MKRDKNVDNAILISAEASKFATFTVHDLKDEMKSGLGHDIIEGHVKLLVDDGLLEPSGFENSLGQNLEKFRLTSKGHKKVNKNQ